MGASLTTPTKGGSTSPVTTGMKSRLQTQKQNIYHGQTNFLMRRETNSGGNNSKAIMDLKQLWNWRI